MASTFSSKVHTEEIKYSFTVDDETTSTVTEASFKNIFEKIFSLYNGPIKELEMPVVLAPEWDNPYISAYNILLNNQIKIGMFGGLARVPGMNDEAVALTICHELGHSLAGAPYFSLSLYKSQSSEGQSDFFATSKCLKKYYKTLPDNKKFLDAEIPKFAKKRCDDKFLDLEKKAICYRTVFAIDGFNHLLQHVHSHNGESSLSVVDDSEIEIEDVNQYPTNQCRLEILMSGALDLKRPTCWFKDSESNNVQEQIPCDRSTSVLEPEIINNIENVLFHTSERMQ